MRALLAVAIGILVAFFVGSVIGTQMVLSSVEKMGLAVSWGMRWSSSWSDIVGLSASLLPLMAIALAPAWLLLAWLDRRAVLTANASIFAICGALCIGTVNTPCSISHLVLTSSRRRDPSRVWPARDWQGHSAVWQ